MKSKSKLLAGLTAVSCTALTTIGATAAQTNSTPLSSHSLNLIHSLIATSVASQAVVEKATFEEKDGIVIIDAENVELAKGWVVKKDSTGFAGKGYLQFGGPGSMSKPNTSTELTYTIKINTPGTYEFKMHTRNGPTALEGDKENDSWLKIEADQLINENNGKDRKKGTADDINDTIPLDHYFKFYVQSLDGWKWGGAPEYHNSNGKKRVAGRVYAKFDKPGIYKINIAGRSKGHRIDRMVLFKKWLKAPYNLSLAQTLATDIPATPSVIDVTGVDIITSPVTFKKAGAKKLLAASVSPSNATDKTLRWSSNNTSVATVSAEGRVTSVKSGTAVITATSANGKSDTVAINVAIPTKPDAPVVDVEKTITLTPSQDAYLQSGKAYNTQQLRVEAGKRTSYLTFNLDSIKGPVKSMKLVMNVGSDSGNGKITLSEAASTSWNERTLSNKTAPKTGAVLAEKTGSLPVGSKLTFDVSKADTTGSVVSFVMTMAKGGNDVSFVSREGKNKGPQLVVTYLEETEQPPQTIDVADVKITTDALTLTQAGAKKQLSATVSPSNATNKSLTWTSSKPSVATINSSGKLIAVASGTTFITAKSSNGQKSTISVTVDIADISTPGEPEKPETPEVPANQPRFKGRIAISLDGNQHDDDDIGASAMALAVMAKAKVQGRLVHYDYNSHLDNSSAKREKEMTESVLGGQERFGFDEDVFFDDMKELNASINNIKNEINKSSAENPLYYILGGPAEVMWRGINASNPAKRKFVTVVSHSWWNENHAGDPNEYHSDSRHVELQKTIEDVIALGVNFQPVNEQNSFFNAQKDWSRMTWLENHNDPKLRWVWERIQKVGTPDYSDAGMVWWVITQNDQGTVEILKDFFGTGTVLGSQPAVYPEVTIPNSGKPKAFGPNTAVRIISLANGKYLCADKVLDETQPPVVANHLSASPWTKFAVKDAGNGYVALKASSTNNMFLQYADSRLRAMTSKLNSAAKFKFTKQTDGSYTILLKETNKYLRASKYANSKTWPLIPGKQLNAAGKFKVIVK